MTINNSHTVSISSPLCAYVPSKSFKLLGHAYRSPTSSHDYYHLCQFFSSSNTPAPSSSSSSQSSSSLSTRTQHSLADFMPQPISPFVVIVTNCAHFRSFPTNTKLELILCEVNVDRMWREQWAMQWWWWWEELHGSSICLVCVCAIQLEISIIWSQLTEYEWVRPCLPFQISREAEVVPFPKGAAWTWKWSGWLSLQTCG